ncbi:hypothetical protein VTN77DRAFT_454 [Rasamsonia byssochlamydoides]|uniref:uncharacterized protein n=1 Tax=Rasamsonia byssochlamydoides TaxID=89139 RepID=UPI0037442E2A
MGTSTSSAYSYSVAPHLQAEFDVPLSAFAAAHAEYTDFVVGGFIFSERRRSTSTSTSITSSSPALMTATATAAAPRMLLLQRAWSDSYGGYWDFPGGSIETESDATLLDGVAREVFEETGYHVSRIRELVTVDTWTRMSRVRGERRVAKFSFIVEVHESAAALSSGGGEEIHAESKDDSVVVQQKPVDWEDQVILAESEHQRYTWATEEEVETSVINKRNGRREEGPYIFAGVQGATALEAFRKYKGLARE